MTIAVILVPAGHVATYASQCFSYCAARAYEVAGIVTDWPAAVATVTAHAAGVIVVARPDHLDPDREPRIEVVCEGAETSPQTATHRRPDRRRRARRV